MFSRVDNFLVITTNNLMALEATTEWVYGILKTTYFIQIELFPNLTLYRIYIPIGQDWDNKIKKKLTEYLTVRHLKLLKEP